jgi:UDP-N-acetylglucosamine--N-acetylmuramyl-(pentapeptide) pyrophosphoryl-undecaprenol N-acetylglucosamine transferase
MKKLKVIISGGGTGGHIFPAIAIANAIKLLVPHVEILFVGALGRMEMERVPAAGYPIKGLPMQGFIRSFSPSNMKVILNLLRSLKLAGKILDEFQPDIAIGVGGYASGALLWVASSRKVPCIIQEQNSYPGITNKLLKKRVKLICVAYSGMDRFFPSHKIILTGNPVRQDLEGKSISKSQALEHFGLQYDKKTILIVGGSLGARSINEGVLAQIDLIPQNEVQLIWQTGKYYYEKIRETISAENYPHIKIYPFISEMLNSYTAADLVISRAGASTISEICLMEKPSILVPSPNVTEDHQTHNAMVLVTENAAILVKDNETGKSLIKKGLELLNQTGLLKEMAENAKKLAVYDSARNIAERALELIDYQDK